MLTNCLVTSVFFAEPQSVAVPYSSSGLSSEAGNIAELTSTGDSIQGRFRNAVTYPAVATADGSRAASTSAGNRGSRARRTSSGLSDPVFADPGLEARLEAQGVEVTALDEDASSWFTVLVSFGPTLLLIAGFFWISGARPPRPGAGSSGSAAAAPSATPRIRQRSRSTTWPASTRPRTSWSRSSTS